MRVALLYIFLCFAFVTRGQNLVNNPSFEEYNECPIPNDCDISNIPHWQWSYSANAYANLCNFSDTVPLSCAAPYTTVDGGCFQYPQDGDAHVNIENFIYPFFFRRNQIQTKLIKPLDSLQCYYFSMYINLCDSCIAATDDIGVLFVKNFISLNFLPNPYDNFPPPQIFHPGEFIQEKEEWIKYEGTFTATGGEEYMLIGSFSKADSIDYILLDNGSQFSNKASYLVDNITLIECNQIGISEKPVSLIKAYPNPSNGVFTIENTKPIKQLKIYNSFGQLVYTESPSTTKTTLDLTHLPAGMYLCNIDGYSIKLIKE
jgi:OOP family OmpA-OmpF porin